MEDRSRCMHASQTMNSPSRNSPRYNRELRVFCRDLCNGYVVAEILSWYYPHEIDLSLFMNASSLSLKVANWQRLKKVGLVSSLLVTPDLSLPFNIHWAIVAATDRSDRRGDCRGDHRQLVARLNRTRVRRRNDRL